MKATLLEVMGDDLMVVNSARVSFAKKHDSFQGENDTKLINYLARHGHWTPFSHPQAQFHIKCPIFVARQLMKHQIGLTINEESRRYIDSDPDFWTPETLRKKAQNKKQGSSDEIIDDDNLHYLINEVHRYLKRVYNTLLEAGVCPEQARAILPLSTYIQFYWTGSLAAWARVCNLRLSEDAQEETREVANQISEQLSLRFPISWAALMSAK